MRAIAENRFTLFGNCSKKRLRHWRSRFDHDGQTFVIIRSPDDKFFCMDGICSHEHVHLADGLVMDDVLECPKHNAQFDYKTDEAVRASACIDLKTFAVKVEGADVQSRIFLLWF